MALANAAVMKAVGSSLYGLRGRVQTVHQALTYLGMRAGGNHHLRDGPARRFPGGGLEPSGAG